VERRLISCQLGSNQTGQSLQCCGQVLGVHLLQLDCNRDVEQFVFLFLSLLFPMSEQASAEHPSKAHERPAVADRAFVTPAVADYLTIKTEDCIREGKATFVQTAFC
jgi:hypothetical protein